MSRTFKRFFLLDQSDFITHFFDSARDILLSPFSESSKEPVIALYDMAVRNSTSVVSLDPFKEDIFVDFSKVSLVDHLSRIAKAGTVDHGSETEFKMESDKPLSTIASMVVGMNIPFPVSLIFNKQIQIKYQLIFRSLLQCKWTEYGLQSTFLLRTETDLPRQFVQQASLLRSTFLSFVQMYLYYVVFEVLEPSWKELETNMKNVQTVEDLFEVHNQSLDTILKECMLTHPKMIKVNSLWLNE
jgi:gamma-tubulin complex component 2